MSKNKKLAIQGLEFVKLFYAEANRLKYMQKHHPEKLQQSCCTCVEPFDTCLKAKELINIVK